MKCVQITKLVMIQHVWIHVDQLFVGEDPVVPPRLNAEVQSRVNIKELNFSYDVITSKIPLLYINPVINQILSQTL